MFELIAFDAPVLHARAEIVTQFNGELRDFVQLMAQTMYLNEGVGLAAPQVGSSLSIMLIDQSGGDDANQLCAMINPCVTWCSEELTQGPEGCLSLPGVSLNVVRAVAVDIEYHDVVGARQKARLTDYAARIAQHEVDHLEGIMMIDRVGPMARRLAMKGLGKAK